MDGGSYDEITLRANRSDYDRLRFHPRVLAKAGMIVEAVRKRARRGESLRELVKEEILRIFNIPRVGIIAGSKVQSGSVERELKARVTQEAQPLLAEGRLLTLVEDELRAKAAEWRHKITGKH